MQSRYEYRTLYYIIYDYKSRFERIPEDDWRPVFKNIDVLIRGIRDGLKHLLHPTNPEFTVDFHPQVTTIKTKLRDSNDGTYYRFEMTFRPGIKYFKMYTYLNRLGDIGESLEDQLLHLLERVFRRLTKESLDKEEARDLQNAEASGILRKPENTIGLAPEGSSIDRAMASGILAKSVGQFLTKEHIKSDTVRPVIQSLKSKVTGTARKRRKNARRKTVRKSA